MAEARDRAADQAFFERRGFSKRIGFGERPAVLVVDLMTAFTDSEMPLGSDLEVELEQANRLIRAAHTRGIPVLFTMVAYEEEGCRDAGLWTLKLSGTFSLAAGGPGVEIDPRLERQPEDPVINKKFASAFFGTDLAARLQFRRIDTLIIAGATTRGCIRATAVDALQYGFRPIVALEAVGDRSAAAHEQSLFDLDAKYADVVSVDEILEQLAG
jgi:nicotinamidase-related amidase